MDRQDLHWLSRRAFLAQGGARLATLLWLAGCAPAGLASPSPTPPPPGRASPSPSPSAVPSIPATMTNPTTVPSTSVAPSPSPSATLAVPIERKLGQMLLVGFRGLQLTPDSPIVADLRDRYLGGVILFDYDTPTGVYRRNIQSPDQVHALTAALREHAAFPLLIGIDQEGGLISRLKPQYGFPPSVSAQYLGSLNDLTVTRQYAAAAAGALAAAGINVNFAPVVDLNLNPNNPVIGKLQRSFSADPAVVTRQAGEWIQAHHAQGVFCTLKHFPGHGSSTADSHLEFVDVTKTWKPVELEPYRSLIAAGQVDLVMTAHIFNSQLDPVWPATLSHSILTGLLRDTLHYDGVIISDDMQMQAIAKYYGLEAAVRAAVQAGVDILAFANNTGFDEQIASKALAILFKLVEAGELTPARIDQSFGRIQRLKARLRA